MTMIYEEDARKDLLNDLVRKLQPDRYRMYFVKPDKIRQAIIGFEHVWGSGLFSEVSSCDYLKEDNLFAVRVRFSHSYPFLEEDFKKWEK